MGCQFLVQPLPSTRFEIHVRHGLCDIMWKKTGKFTLLAILVLTIDGILGGAIVWRGVTIGSTIGGKMVQLAEERMVPPLHKEYKHLEDEIYARYLSDGALPPLETLSASAQRTVAENEGIDYSAEEGASYFYDKPYPLNVPLVGIVTCGLWWGGVQECAGESQAPEHLIHNAKLRAEREKKRQ